MFRLKHLLFICCVFIPFTAKAAPADPDVWAPRMADAFVALMGTNIPANEKPLITADMRRLIDAFADEPLLAEKAPPAFVQAASLAQDASIPATRGSAYDLARTVLDTAVLRSGKPENDFAPIRLWNQIDPVKAKEQNLKLAASDIKAADKLLALDKSAKIGVFVNGSTADKIVMDFWKKNQDQPANHVLPTRLQAWVDGVEAAWPNLSAQDRIDALSVLTSPKIPSATLFEKVLGTENIIYWLAAVELPMSAAERSASPDLVHFMEMGAFAGPLKQPLLESLQMQATQGTGINPAAEQLRRLNNWGAMTGEMQSWDSYKYMTQ